MGEGFFRGEDGVGSVRLSMEGAAIREAFAAIRRGLDRLENLLLSEKP